VLACLGCPPMRPSRKVPARLGESARDIVLSWSRVLDAEAVRWIVGLKITSLPLNIWLADPCVSSLAEANAADDSGSSRE